MRKVNIRSSRNVGTKETPVKNYFVEEVDMPENSEELCELIDNPEKYPATAKFFKDYATLKTTIGYKGVTKTNPGEREYGTLDFITAMFWEGFKLHVNGIISPEATDNGVTDEDVKAFEAAGQKEHAVLIWTIGNAKTKKALRDEVLKWKADSKLTDL